MNSLAGLSAIPGTFSFGPRGGSYGPTDISQITSSQATGLTAAQINSKAQSYFTGLYVNPDAKSVSVSATLLQRTSLFGAQRECNSTIT